MTSVNTQQVVEKVRSLPGDFSTATDSDIEQQIDNAQDLYIATKPWLNAGKLNIGLALGAAHLLAKNGKIQNSPDGMTMAGKTVSISEGDQSVSSQPTSGGRSSNSDLQGTVYGRMLEEQKHSIPTSPMVGI